MKKIGKNKLFIIRKYVRARTASDAIRRDKITPVHDVWIDEEWKRNQNTNLAEAIGFNAPPQKEDDDDA